MADYRSWNVKPLAGVMAALVGVLLWVGISLAGQEKDKGSGEGVDSKASATGVRRAEETFKRYLGDCAQCHEDKCGNLGAAVREEWIKPGDPEGSQLVSQLKDSSQWEMNMQSAVRLSDADKKAIYEYIKNLKSSDVPAITSVNASAGGEKPHKAIPAAQAEMTFKRVLSACAQCHRAQSQSVNTAVQSGRVKPGNPEGSLLYKQVKGLHMRAATGLGVAEATGVYDYIKNLKDADVHVTGSGNLSPPSSVGPVWARKPAPQPEAPTKRLKPDAFQASFYCLSTPTGEMTCDREEIALRYQACDLGHQIAFLETIPKLGLTRDQAQKLLPFAQKARDMYEQRASELRDCWRAYAGMCNWQRKFMVMSFKGCDRGMINRTIGESGFCGCPAYSVGRFDKTEEFYTEMAALGTEAEGAVLLDVQKEKLPDIKAELGWVELPIHTRRAVIKAGGTRASIGALGQLLLAPNAVAWLEKAAGRDADESARRAKEFLPLGAELIQRHRDMVCYDLRLVDGANVISGFNFTEKQLNSLIDMLQGEVKEIHAGHAEDNKKNLRPLVVLLAGMREDVEQGRGLTEEKKRQEIEFQQGICRGNYRSKGHTGVGRYDYTQGSLLCPIHKDYTRKMEAVFERLNGEVLYESQCKLLYDTHVCQWWPPGYYSDPVRVGQAAQQVVYPEHAVIARLRAAAEGEYAGERNGYAGELADRLLAGKTSAGRKEKEVQRIAAALDSIRLMSEADYELNKYTLLGNILKKSCPEMAGSTVFKAITDADVKDLTWDMFAKQENLTIAWSPYDFMKAMTKAGKPLPSLTEQAVPYAWIEWPIYLREMPAYFLMDPNVVPSLEIMRIIAREPAKMGAAK